MKKIIGIITAIVFGLASCTNQQTAEKSVLSNDWVNEIKLDEGKQWQANLATTKGVVAMQVLVNRRTEKTVGTYQLLATNLVKEQNQLIQACSMQGEAHENLHTFLHPLIDKIAHLSKVKTEEEGRETASSIGTNLSLYHKYFK